MPANVHCRGGRRHRALAARQPGCAARRAGYVLLYVLVTLALLALAGAFAAIVRSEGEVGPAWVFAAVAAVVAAVGLRVEIRRDALAAGMYLAGVSGAVAMFAIVYLFSAHVASPPVFLLAVVSGSLALGLTWHQHRAKNRPESPHFPNLLRRDVPEDQIFETNGIQIAMAAGPFQPDGTAAMRVLLQSSWSAPRHVMLRLDDGGLKTNRPAGARFPSRASVQLGPAEAGELTFTVAGPPSGADFKLHLGMSVNGTGGKRVRHWQARAVEGRINPKVTAAATPFGVFTWGGGLFLRLPPSPPGARPDVVPPPQWRVTWSPGPGTLPR